MEQVFENGLLVFGRAVDLPAGTYIVSTKCYLNTRNANRPELYNKVAKHEVVLEANTTVVFDFVKYNQRECTLNQRVRR
jgi:hypothetical protein